MKTLLWILIAILLLAHQDFWFWDDPTLVFGFLPIGLAYHMGISLVAGFVWWLMCVFAWPKHLDELDAAPPSAGEGH